MDLVSDLFVIALLVNNLKYVGCFATYHAFQYMFRQNCYVHLRPLATPYGSACRKMYDLATSDFFYRYLMVNFQTRGCAP